MTDQSDDRLQPAQAETSPARVSEPKPNGRKPVVFKSLLLWLAALAMVRGVLYASFVPPWQAPDEPAQFERARAAVSAREWNSTAENGPAWYGDLGRSLFTFHFWDYLDDRRPVYSPDTLLNQYIVLYQEAYDGLYGSRLAYGLIGWPLFLARHQDIVLQLYLVRLNMVLMNVGIIILTYFIAREIFPDSRFLQLGAPILILFNPQHTHLLSTVNNGNLAELLATAALYFIVRGIIRGFGLFSLLAAIGLSLMAMWAKATAYFLAFAIGCVGLFYVWRYRRHWRWLLPVGVLGAVLAYFFSPERLKLLLVWAWEGAVTGRFYLDPIVPIDLFRSFWAMPGWIILELHPFWYQVLAIGCLLALAGLLALAFTRRKEIFAPGSRPKVEALVVLAAAVVVAIGVLLGWNAVTESIIYRQGRSIYPVIAPICLFLMLGWRQLIPTGWRKEGLLAISVGLFLFDSLVLFYYILPLFYSRYY